MVSALTGSGASALISMKVRPALAGFQLAAPVRAFNGAADPRATLIQVADIKRLWARGINHQRRGCESPERRPAFITVQVSPPSVLLMIPQQPHSVTLTFPAASLNTDVLLL